MACVFCQIVHGELPSHVVAENDEFLAFLSIYPNTLGATVVIPKQHFSSYAFDLNDEILFKLVKFTKQVAKKLDLYFEDVARTAMVFEGFGVDHVHAKLFPMHGTQHTQHHWQPIKSSVDLYFDQYQGYISSHDYQREDDAKLAALAQKIRAMPH